MSALTVATFNIRNGWAFDGWNSWPFRRGAVLRTIRALDADVVALQEVHGFQERWLRRRLRGYVAFGRGRDDGRKGERCLTLVRRSALTVEWWDTRWYGGGVGARLPEASFPRVATLAVLSGASGASGASDGSGGGAARFGVVNTHLDEHYEGNRLRSVRELVAWLDPSLPWVVAGDLNCTPGSDALEVLAAAGFRPTLPPGAPGTTHDFRGDTAGPRLDHLLVSARWWVLTAEVAVSSDRRLPSDHWPVVARVEMAP